jgi:hypothetical protein
LKDNYAANDVDKLETFDHKDMDEKVVSSEVIRRHVGEKIGQK